MFRSFSVVIFRKVFTRRVYYKDKDKQPNYKVINFKYVIHNIHVR